MADQPLSYHDFRIELSNLKADNTFTVRVMGETPHGKTMRADQAETVTFNRDDFTALVGRVDRRRASQSELFQLGAKLCGLLLPGGVRTLFDGSVQWAEQNKAGVRVRLSVEPLPLSALPWEYTHVPRVVGEQSANDFLVLQRRVSLVRTENIGSAVEPLEGKNKLRLVAALASPQGDASLPELDLLKEMNAIKGAVSNVNKQVPTIDPVFLNPATRAALLAAIKGTDIFHFAGHGVFSPTNDGTFSRRGQIALEKDDETADLFPSDQLANLLSDAGTRLAVLGACESATRDEGGAWSGVAPALAREKIPCVVAMQFKVADTEAARFMTQLYGGMVGGLSIDEAVFMGRQAIFNQAADWAQTRDWGVPVVYLLAPDGNLFPLPADTSSAADSPLVEVREKIGTVRGKATGADIGDFFGGKVDVNMDIGTVEETGEVVGVKLGSLGGRRRN